MRCEIDGVINNKGEDQLLSIKVMRLNRQHSTAQHDMAWPDGEGATRPGIACSQCRLCVGCSRGVESSFPLPRRDRMKERS